MTGTLALPYLPLPQTYAPWPVWSDSTTQTVRFQPMPKKAAVRLWHRARDFDRGTHQPGRHGGAVGPTALQVLHALIFDFLNHRTGRLDPSYAAIARKANVCERAVATALKRLRELAALPDDQQAKVRAALKMQADAADNYNTEFLPFTVGEEATHQMQKTFSHLLDLIGAYQAIGRPPPLE